MQKKMQEIKLNAQIPWKKAQGKEDKVKLARSTRNDEHKASSGEQEVRSKDKNSRAKFVLVALRWFEDLSSSDEFMVVGRYHIFSLTRLDALWQVMGQKDKFHRASSWSLGETG